MLYAVGAGNGVKCVMVVACSTQAFPVHDVVIFNLYYLPHMLIVACIAKFNLRGSHELDFYSTTTLVVFDSGNGIT
jgi:hypothetical protein